MSSYADSLGGLVRDTLIAKAAELSLRADRLSVESVLNRGGFVNRSFAVSDGVRALHVKLGTDAPARAALGRWRELHAVLEGRYHAPPMVGWLAIPGTEYAGPIFERVDGAPPESLSPELFSAVQSMLLRLHDDPELRAALNDGAERSCAQVYLDAYADRFREDLRGILESPPPFVHEERLALMQNAADRLTRDVCASSAFAGPARAPTHGDLWAENFLVTSAGDWFLLDWDQLSLGDPALDLGMLHAASAPGTPRPGFGDALVEARLELYERAVVIDWMIDPLADWIESDRVLTDANAFRARKRADHEAAYERYGQRYG